MRKKNSLADIIKGKMNGFNEELLTEIKLLIKSEVDEGLKNQKEEFDSAFTQLQNWRMKKTIWSNMVDPSV